MQITVTDEPVNLTEELELKISGRYAIQNASQETPIYLGWSSDDATSNTGLRLPGGALYEFPAQLASAGSNLWVVAPDSQSVDVRVLRVG